MKGLYFDFHPLDKTRLFLGISLDEMSRTFPMYNGFYRVFELRIGLIFFHIGCGWVVSKVEEHSEEEHLTMEEGAN